MLRAFVERYERLTKDHSTGGTATRVSPEFMLRPSLSESRCAEACPRNRPLLVSPEFMLRPSLSAVLVLRTLAHRGETSPEFVLRASLSERENPYVSPAGLR